ncbi:MAG: VWA domain-containing protein, partial [Herpetosiphonaceae bacterium]|nr:VWA domain-containing protein [Herpetosiphonaceae bacterium]
MSLSFVQPAYLWLLLLLLPFAGLTLLTPRRSARWRLWSSLALRTFIFVALVCALAGAQWVGRADHLTTVFMIDSSDSISPSARARAEAYIQTALTRMPTGDRAAVIVFGKEPLVERAPSDSRQWVRLTVAPPGSYTDIDRALQLALAIMPAETRKRIVLLSDGGENRGQAMNTATLARAAQIPIETVSLQGAPPSGDVVLEAVEAPASARDGQALRLTLQVRAPQATTARLRLLLDRQPVFEQQVALQAKLNRIPITVPAPGIGFHTWEAHIDASGDTVGANNVGFGFSSIQGAPKIAIVEGTPGRGSNLAAALQAAHMQVATLAPAGLPASLVGLDAYAAVVLVDVPYHSLPPATGRLLPAYVRELGHGLLMVGGADSYAAGGYLNTPLEGALPVTMRTRGVKIRPDVALVLVIDHSGSMAGDKLDLAREGAAQAFGALDDSDQIGVIQFDSTADWVVPLQKRPPSDSFLSALQGIGVGGGTDLRPGLVAAADALEKAQARIKHIVLLTDGQADANYDDVVARLKGDGITLSAVGVGEDYDPHLKDIAPVTGGRFYEARNFADIPALFFDETLRISRRGIVEHDFIPTLSFPAAALRDINAVPPLHGYNAVTPKSNAQVVLQSDESDPILAQWQYGLGRAAAWTSDLRGQWGRDWVAWQDFSRFVDQLVGSLLPVPTPSGWEAATNVEGAALVLSLRADGLDNQPRTGLHPTGRLIAADGRVIEVPLSEVTPGRYRATMSLPDAGVYQAQVVAMGPDGQIEGLAQTGAVVPPSAEYLQRDGNVGLLQALAQTTGGHFDPQPTQAWSLPPTTTRRTA